MSKIEWTEKTWSPTVGCSIASTGCAGCYAVSECWRKMHHPHAAVAEKFKDTVRRTAAGQLVWTGQINFSEQALLEPLKRKAPTTWFVNSMSDLFHESLSFAIVDRIIAVIAMTQQHRYQLLTKRGDRMAEYFEGNWRERVSAIVNAWPDDLIFHGNEFTGDMVLATKRFLPNVALGVSVENQLAEWRIEHLRYIPAAIRFLSCEPLVGPLSIKRYLPDLDWVICGGESGPKARIMEIDWARNLRDECAEFEHVAFFFKQWGDWFPVGPFFGEHGEETPGQQVLVDNTKILRSGDEWVDPRKCVMIDINGANWANDEAQPPSHVFVYERRGKKKSGRVLDDETHDALPTWKDYHENAR